MRPSLSRSAKNIFLKSGIYGFIRRLFPNPKVAILRYHAVIDNKSNHYTSPSIAISPREFEEHVRYFSKNYHVLSLDLVINCIQQENKVPANGIIFTFDDGYADNFLAAQILKKYGASGTFFITTEPIEKGSRLWLTEVIYLILRTTQENLKLETQNYSGNFSLVDISSRWKVIREIIGYIKSNNKAFREEVLGQIIKQLGTKTLLKEMENLMLSWDQVKNMAEMGMIIGSHTLTHLNLPNADPNDAFNEIRESKHVLETQLGNSIRHFSYPNSGPYDYYNEEIRKFVIKSGYDSSCTSKQGFVDSKCDLFALNRIRTVPALEEVIHSIEFERIL